MLDPNLIQNFLTTFSPFIIKDLKAKNIWSQGKRTILLEPTTNNLSDAEAGDVSLSQNQILSDTVVVDKNMSTEIFGDKSKAILETDYEIRHSLIYQYKPNFFGIANITKDINKNIIKITDKSPAPKIFVYNITIKNNAKDIYTTKLNYSVTLSVAFNDFQDLLEEDIPLSAFGDNARVDLAGNTKNIKFLNLLYRNFNLPNNAPIQQKHEYDNYGLMLQMKFIPTPNSTIFKNTKQLIPEITKNLHLTYKQHNFNLFKNNNPWPLPFQHELVVEYQTSDADLSPKVDLPEDVESVSGGDNLYKLLESAADTAVSDDTWVSKNYAPSANGAKFTLSQILDEIKKTNSWISTFRKEINCLPPDQDFSNYTFKPFGGEAFKISEMEKRIADWKQRIVDYRNIIKLELVKKIESEVPLYELEVPQVFLNFYEQDNYSRDFEANGGATNAWQAGVLGAVGVLALGGAVALTTAATGGAAAAFWIPFLTTVGTGAAFGAVSSGIASYQKSKEAKEIETDSLNIPIDELLSNISGKIVTSKVQNKPSIGLNAFSVAARPEADPKKEEERLLKERQAALDAANGTTLESISKATNQKVKIKFILFGDIMKLLTLIAPNLRLLFGGKIYSIDGVNHDFINFYNIPISFALFREFLIDHIVNQPRPFYNTDIFIKDVFEALLKKSLQGASGEISQEGKVFLPNKIFLNSTLHNKEQRAINAFGDIGDSRIYNPSNYDADFKQFKIDFAISKNFTNGMGKDNYLKVVSFLSMDDMKFKNFYKAYENWSIDKTDIPFREKASISSIHFQKFINQEYLRPCIFISKTGADVTILKNKNLSFTRVDNANLMWSNIIEGAPLFRLPYNFSSDLKDFLFFFTGIGSYIFITPPESKQNVTSTTFGFGGLYVLNKVDYSYAFQKSTSSGISIPGFESKTSVSGIFISYGEGINKPKNTNLQGQKTPVPVDPLCEDFLKTAQEVEHREPQGAAIGRRGGV